MCRNSTPAFIPKSLIQTFDAWKSEIRGHFEHDTSSRSSDRIQRFNVYKQFAAFPNVDTDGNSPYPWYSTTALSQVGKEVLRNSEAGESQAAASDPPGM